MSNRYQVVIDEDLHQAIKEFRASERIPSMSKAIAMLTAVGLDHEEECRKMVEDMYEKVKE